MTPPANWTWGILAPVRERRRPFFAENQRPETVRAIVSRGGRPDLAGQALKRVRAPTLFIVGENDDQILKLNEWAMERMEMPRRLIVVPGATHLFEEPGTLAVVAERTAEWFLQYLDADRPPVPWSGRP